AGRPPRAVLASTGRCCRGGIFCPGGGKKRPSPRRIRGREPLTVEETDRAVRLARVAELAERIFGDKAKAHRWLRKPKRTLSQATPLTYLASEAGARLVEDMLYRIDYGILA